MKSNFKDYQIVKIRNYFWEKNLYFFVHGNSKSLNNKIVLDQNLKSIHLYYYKLCVKVCKKVLKDSIYKNIRWVVNNMLDKKVLIKNFRTNRSYCNHDQKYWI